MSWLTDLAPIFGGSVTLAGAMYGACAAAEKAARPEALQDIGRILKDPSWSRSVRPSAIIERMFVWTFGERLLSWKCVERSATASMTMIAIVAFAVHTVWGTDFFGINLMWTIIAPQPGLRPGVLPDPPETIIGLCIALILAAIIPDFIALAKTRLLMRATRTTSATIGLAFVLIADIIISSAISIIISTLIIGTFRYFIHFLYTSDITHGLTISVLFTLLGSEGINTSFRESFSLIGAIKMVPMIFLNISNESATLLPAFMVSTLFTSIWMSLILLSTAVLKLLTPLQRFTTWFFDVDKHPVQAIGIVAGTLVMIGSLVWSIVRAVI